ncbi:MAG: DMT family transporter [Bacillota bacterium]
MRNTNLIYLLMVLVAIFWGGTFNAATFALKDLEPFTVAFFRFAITVLFLAPLSRRALATAKVSKRDLCGFFLMGLTGVFAYNAFFLTGMRFTSAVNGSLIVSASPMVTTLLAIPFLHEKITMTKLSGFLLSFLGVTLVVSGGSLYNLLALQVNKGDLIILGGMLSWSLYALVGKRVMSRFSPLVTTTYSILFGALLLLPCALLSDPGFKSLAHASWPALSAVLYMAIFASVLAFLWWNQGVDRLGAGPASIFLNLIPVATMVISLFFREPVVLTQVLGCLLVIAGISLTASKVRVGKRGDGSFASIAD